MSELYDALRCAIYYAEEYETAEVTKHREELAEKYKNYKEYDIPHIGKVECTEEVAVKLELLIYKAAHYEFLEARKERDMIYPFPTDDEEWKRHINNSNNYYEASNYLFRENIGYWSDIDRKVDNNE